MSIEDSHQGALVCKVDVEGAVGARQLSGQEGGCALRATPMEGRLNNGMRLRSCCGPPGQATQ